MMHCKEALALSLRVLVDLTEKNPHAAVCALSEWGPCDFLLHSVDDDGAHSRGRRCGQIADKRPRTRDGHLAASDSPDQIDTWWGQWPDANIGIATGGNSGVW